MMAAMPHQTEGLRNTPIPCQSPMSPSAGLGICREFRALKNKAQKWTAEAMDDIRSVFPVPLKGIDSDNGIEFINWHLKGWCEKHRINFT